MKLKFSVQSDLVQVGTHFEDGEPIIRQCFYVRAEAEDGRRWVHQRSFCTAQGPADPETDMARAEMLCSRIEEVGIIDLRFWDEVDPRYGSPAYIREGIEEQRWMEERRDAGIGY